VPVHEPQQLPAAHQRHEQVEQDGRWLSLDGLQVVRHLLAVARRDHVVAGTLEKVGDEVSKLVVVLCHHDRQRPIHSSTLRLPARSAKSCTNFQ